MVPTVDIKGMGSFPLRREQETMSFPATLMRSNKIRWCGVPPTQIWKAAGPSCLPCTVVPPATTLAGGEATKKKKKKKITGLSFFFFVPVSAICCQPHTNSITAWKELSGNQWPKSKDCVAEGMGWEHRKTRKEELKRFRPEEWNWNDEQRKKKKKMKTVTRYRGRRRK